MTKDEALKAAAELSALAVHIEKTYEARLDASGVVCECCGATHYASFPQKVLKEKVRGLAEKVRNIADIYKAGADNPKFCL